MFGIVINTIYLNIINYLSQCSFKIHKKRKCTILSSDNDRVSTKMAKMQRIGFSQPVITQNKPVYFVIMAYYIVILLLLWL